jgi:hypothetical protein
MHRAQVMAKMDACTLADLVHAAELLREARVLTPPPPSGR